MSDRIMTTRELAAYIKLNEKTVIKMAQNGQLPGVKISNKWRFYLSHINEHLENAVARMPDDDLNILIKTSNTIIPLSRLTSEELIKLDLVSENKEDVLRELAAIAGAAGIVSSEKGFLALMIEREKMLSTALGHGVAIPHPRDPEPSMFRVPNIIIGRSKKGIDFGAPDNEKTHLFFVLCATTGFVHLRLLAKVSKLLHVPNINQRLRDVEDADAVMKLLLEFERTQILPLSEGFENT